MRTENKKQQIVKHLITRFMLSEQDAIEIVNEDFKFFEYLKTPSRIAEAIITTR